MMWLRVISTHDWPASSADDCLVFPLARRMRPRRAGRRRAAGCMARHRHPFVRPDSRNVGTSTSDADDVAITSRPDAADVAITSRPDAADVSDNGRTIADTIDTQPEASPRDADVTDPPPTDDGGPDAPIDAASEPGPCPLGIELSGDGFRAGQLVVEPGSAQLFWATADKGASIGRLGSRQRSLARKTTREVSGCMVAGSTGRTSRGPRTTTVRFAAHPFRSRSQSIRIGCIRAITRKRSTRSPNRRLSITIPGPELQRDGAARRLSRRYWHKCHTRT